MYRLLQRFATSIAHQHQRPSFWVAIGLATVGYFSLTRILQDWLYRGWQRPSDLFASYGEKFLDAEPLEIPLYFLGYAVIPLLALVLRWAARRCWPVVFRNRRLRRVGVAVVVIATVLAATQLPFGRWYEFLQRAEHYRQTQGFGRVLWLLLTKRIFVSTLLLSGSTLTFALTYLAGRRRQFSLTPPVALERWLAGWGWLTVPIVAALVFHPNFPVEPHHASYFLAPVNDQLLGKPLLYETSSLYGILSHYFLLAIFGTALLPLRYPALILVLMAVFFGFLVGLYAVLRRWLNSPTYAVVGTLAVFITLFLFQTSPTRSVYNFPALTPFRFWLALPVLALLVRFQQTKRPHLARFAVALSAVAVFWNVETGVALSAATFLTLLAAGRARVWVSLVSLVGGFFAWVLGAFLLISGANFLVYGRWPVWLAYLQELGEFARGIAMYPLPAVGVFEVFVVGAVIVVLWQVFGATDVRLDVPLLFLALFGAFAMIHYVGESTWQTLFMAAWPFVVLAAVIGDRVATAPLLAGHRLVVSALVAGAFFFVGLLSVKLPVELGHRNYRTISASFREPPTRDAALLRDAAIIRRDFADVRLPLLHFRDVKLLLYAGKTNWFNVYYNFNLYYKSQVAQLADDVIRARPRYVLVGNGTDAVDEFERNRANELVAFFTPLLPSDYVLDQSLETVDIYQLQP